MEPNPIAKSDDVTTIAESGAESASVHQLGEDQPSQQLTSTPCHWSARLVRGSLIGLVRVYQGTLSPFLGGYCRFEPSCSNYFIQAVRKYGAIRGSLKGVMRICRCHPFGSSGYDPP